MKILCIDADSTIPNLPLMKLSTYHKNRNDKVDIIKLNLPYYPHKKRKIHYIPKNKFDKIYCSIIFEGNKQYIQGKEIEYGGTGFDLKIKLPPQIENLKPDYSLYPDNKFSYGFISRGCIRNCKFCYVPKKEGNIHKVNDPENIIEHKIVKFLDNNILALPEHKQILRKLINLQIKCQFNQGLDIRLINEKNSKLIQRLNYFGDYLFAFDDWKYKELISEKLNFLLWRKHFKFKFYTYIHPEMSFSNIIKRLEWLKKNKLLPYVMRNKECWDSSYSKFYIDLAAWGNQPHLFMKMDFKTFLIKRHKNKKRIKLHIEYYYDNT